ncbi:MAG: hypothetical protein MR821_04110 [Clostridiales bacterium]|nr:hypothetical protein [Clostridiales bacterium]
MELVLFGAALCAFFAGGPSAALLLRCGLNASLRFSPRAALALSSLCALSGALAQLLARGGLRAVPGQRAALVTLSFTGGVLGRALLLMLVARFPDSLLLLQVQALPLLLILLLSLLPEMRRFAAAPFAAAFPAAALGGFLGAGEAALLRLFLPAGVIRGRQSAAALLSSACAQGGALLLTLLCGAAQVFPARLLASAALGAALGALCAEGCKERGALRSGMRAALLVYGILAALACVEQAFG